MPHFKIRSFHPDDFEAVMSMQLSEEDLREHRAATGINYEPAILCLTAVFAEQWSYVFTVDDLVLGIFGISDSGDIFLVLDQRARKYPKAILKLARHFLAGVRRDFSKSWNWVHTGNAPAINFLEHLGATFLDEMKTSGGLLFRKFTFV